MKIFVCNRLQGFFVIYAKEINQLLNNTIFNTDKPVDADYLITCLSDERNYPIFGNMEYANSKIEIKNINAFLNKHFHIKKSQKIIIFYHTPQNVESNVITACYSKDENDLHNIVICPPAIKNYTFNSILDKKKYFVSFKGNVNASKNRLNAFNVFKKYNNKKNIIIDKTNNNFDYSDLMLNSVFCIIIEGDLPWSYRFTEAINAGSIPIIVKPKNKNILAFHELIDYSLFSIIVEPDNIDNLMSNILPKLSVAKISQMLNELEIVNNKYFISRQRQMDGVLEILANRMK